MPIKKIIICDKCNKEIGIYHTGNSSNTLELKRVTSQQLRVGDALVKWTDTDWILCDACRCLICAKLKELLPAK